MRKLYAILVSLLFVASVIGIAAVTAQGTIVATPSVVKVGGIITVNSGMSSEVPEVIGTRKRCTCFWTN